MAWGRGLWYDRDGQPLSDWREWEALRMRGEDYIRVASTSGPRWWVSTVWLGLDHGHTPHAPPMIFETMVFGGPLDGECSRYPTEAEAHAGHEVMVASVEQAIRRERLARMVKHKHLQRRRNRNRG